jgi:hypothetical protein
MYLYSTDTDTFARNTFIVICNDVLWELLINFFVPSPIEHRDKVYSRIINIERYPDSEDVILPFSIHPRFRSHSE